jgi:S-adenosylmethionine:tRNA ribosyltransferase-isomerase
MSSNKTSVQNTSIAEFDYNLPEERIAKYPLEPRDGSNLLVYKNGEIQSHIYSKLHEHLPENTLLVMNNTKVVEARLLFKKRTGSTIEIFCLEPHDSYPDITSAMLQTKPA